MAYAHPAFEIEHMTGVEDVAHEAFGLMQVQATRLAGHDASGILPAMLQNG
jgi:hypothetical protein